MRILLMPSSYAPVLGGLQTVAQTLAQHLSCSHEVQVLTNHYPRCLPAHEVVDGVAVRRWLFLSPRLTDLRRRRLDLLLASFCIRPYTLMRLNRLMHTFRPQVVNVHFPDNQIPYVLWLRRHFSFRLVASLHGHEIERFFEADQDELHQSAFAATRERRSSAEQMRVLLRSADAVTACSRYLLDKAITLEPTVVAKGQAIYNGVDLQRFREKTAHPHSRPYILAYGRMTYKKGFDLLIEAFAPVAARCSDLDLVLAGDGEERSNLQARVRQLGMEARVHFYGRATPQQVVQLLNGCRGVVIPSRQEPFGIVAIEALAAGKPVLATQVGGLVEVLQGSGSYFVSPNVLELQQALLRWIDSIDGRIREYPTFSPERHDWKHIVGQFEQVYQTETMH